METSNSENDRRIDYVEMNVSDIARAKTRTRQERGAFRARVRYPGFPASFAI